MTSTTTYVPYDPDLERPKPDEDTYIDKIVGSLRGNNERAYRKTKRGLRDAHAKSHGILRGTLEVHDELDDELAQGLFAHGGRSFDIITRLSSTSGAIRSDQMRGVRGLGIKVLGVGGERALPDDTAMTQDFIMVTHRDFLFADAEAYYKRGMPTAWALARLPDPALKIGSELLAGVDKRLLCPIGRPLPESLAVFVRPNTHILGDTFYSSAPLRYGEYVARMAFVPSSPEVHALAGMPVDDGTGVNAFQDMVVDFFSCHGAEYELRVQLCASSDRRWIEDATFDWPEDVSPHRTVATIRFAQQDPYTPERRAYGDDVLSFNSWRGLDAHRPLGSINRLKRKVYDASSQFRHQVNNAPMSEPADAGDLPE
ncbi:catalase family protein [Gordonia sp. DT101]|uniref:catalase family protein n=1 Tax=Gordonia sp. DT101 TaxID=3416545 RepID=UPI003CF56F6B